MIAVVTRTSRRPNYFERCYQSVRSQNPSCRHYVLYDTEQSKDYLINRDIHVTFVDRRHYEASYRDPPPKTAIPPLLSLHNLYFNEIYHSIAEDWVYHLDDDNYLAPNAFARIVPYLHDPVDLVFVRIQHYTGLLPPDRQWERKHLPVGFIDTGCFLARTSILRKIRWDGWKCGDYRAIQQCASLARKVLWFNTVVMHMEAQGLGKQQDRSFP
ncbi:MAG: hypothetical protein VX278_13675 [Myxococcota bacterium]|nr:hypothetical protein [Myxococcota bacterium]